jgi:hypothetical protein
MARCLENCEGVRGDGEHASGIDYQDPNADACERGQGGLPGARMEVGRMSALRTAAELIQVRDVVRRIMGERWPSIVDELRPEIERIMRAAKNDNPISAIVPIAKAMSAEGKNPMTLLAVAVEMSSPSKGPS